MSLTLSTKLEAVNEILGAIGEAPVNTLNAGSGKPIQAVQAETLLDNTSREIQAKGWHFNSEKKYPLTRANDNTITVPSNTLQVDTEVGKYIDIDIVQRGTSLYDKKNHRSTFTQDLEVDIVFLLDFTELPEQFRQWITIRAARKMAARFVGSGEIEVFTLRDEMEAKAMARRSNAKNADHTIFDNELSTITLRR
jgi:hypothetical protein